jgi:hydroxyacylglutathione hydrolase
VIFRPVPNEATGCLAYLLGCEREGVAAVIDPVRPDLDPWLGLARAKGLRITHVLDTHIHADHVSAARDLAAATGATVGLHEAADVRYPHARLRDGQHVRLGTVDLHVLHTPGHTPESMCLVVTDTTRGDEPWFVLTGDTLFVGDVGRPDFGGASAAAELHRSLFDRLLPLGDALEVFPAHGAGSLCGRAMSSKIGSTIGFERRCNPALRHRDAEAFVRALLEGLPPRPPSMDRIIAKNRGLLGLGHGALRPLAPGALGARLAAGAVLVDLRDPEAFGAAHVAGSVHVWIESPQFAERLAWAVPPGRPLLLLARSEAEVARAVAALARIGLDEVAGYVADAGGPAATGLPLRQLPGVTAPELARRLAEEPDLLLLDVREPHEWAEGHIPGARHLPMRRVLERLDELPRDRRLAIACAGGTRSSLVASLLLARGFTEVLNVRGGMAAWAQAGLPVVRD